MPLIAAARRAAGGILGRMWRLARDGSYRNAFWLRLAGAKAFQLSGQTYENRYPFIFSFVQTELRAIPVAHILSFGCSTGAEVFWLRRYFPDAVIKGVDVNGGSIAVCRERAKREGDSNVSFAIANSPEGEPPEFTTRSSAWPSCATGGCPCPEPNAAIT